MILCLFLYSQKPLVNYTFYFRLSAYKGSIRVQSRERKAGWHWRPAPEDLTAREMHCTLIPGLFLTKTNIYKQLCRISKLQLSMIGSVMGAGLFLRLFGFLLSHVWSWCRSNGKRTPTALQGWKPSRPRRWKLRRLELWLGALFLINSMKRKCWVNY